MSYTAKPEWEVHENPDFSVEKLLDLAGHFDSHDPKETEGRNKMQAEIMQAYRDAMRYNIKMADSTNVSDKERKDKNQDNLHFIDGMKDFYYRSTLVSGIKELTPVLVLAALSLGFGIGLGIKVRL